jgi:uncharacterized protein YbbC (DUF1343 family)
MVRNGIINLLKDRKDLVAGRRVGLVSHAPAVTPDLTGIVDAMLAAGVNLTTLFGPEHGFSGIALNGKVINDAVDPHTGLPVFSLYGEIREPTLEMLSNVDVLVVDFQDVGVRFYTYLSTLYYVLHAAGKYGIPVVVLDRVNPINGNGVEGPLIDPGLESFVGIVANLPVRHGMTFGELAQYFNAEYKLNAALTIVPIEGWKRSMWFDQTGLPWVIPSPALPSLAASVVYPGTCFFEGTNLSEGRGTPLPFEVIGAPWIDGYALAEHMNALALPGVRFRPLNFQPTASKHAGLTCQGVQLHVLDRDAFLPVRTGLHLVSACRSLAPADFAFNPRRADGRPPAMDVLSGSTRNREHIAAGLPADELISSWTRAEEWFKTMRAPYLIYS